MVKKKEKLLKNPKITIFQVNIKMVRKMAKDNFPMS